MINSSKSNNNNGKDKAIAKGACLTCLMKL